MDGAPFAGQRTDFTAIADRNCYNRQRETARPDGPAAKRAIARERRRDPEHAKKEREAKLRGRLDTFSGSGAGGPPGGLEQPSLAISELSRDDTLEGGGAGGGDFGGGWDTDDPAAPATPGKEPHKRRSARLTAAQVNARGCALAFDWDRARLVFRCFLVGSFAR